MMLTITDHLMMNVKGDTETKISSIYRLEYSNICACGECRRKRRDG